MVSPYAFSSYNANMAGVISEVITYVDRNVIYFKLENQPSSHPSCHADYFSIVESVTAERRSILLSRLLAAYAIKEVVNIGYDSTGDCSDGRIRVHRVGWIYNKATLVRTDNVPIEGRIESNWRGVQFQNILSHGRPGSILTVSKLKRSSWVWLRELSLSELATLSKYIHAVTIAKIVWWG